MGSGYKFSLNHRYGGHDGPTEWEISSSTPEVKHRIAEIKRLNHRYLCGFVVDPTSHHNALCIRQCSPRWVLALVIDILSAWPEDVDTCFRQLAEHPTFPDEVVERVRNLYAPFPLSRELWHPEPELLAAFPKEDFDRSAAWDLTRSYGRSRRIEDYEWRRVHTQNYWAWYARDKSKSGRISETRNVPTGLQRGNPRPAG